MKRILLIFTLAASVCMGALAQSAQEKVLALQSGNATYSSPFTETKVFPRLKKQTEKKGTLVWRAEDYLRMDFTDPEGDYTLIDGTEFSICLKGAVQKLPAKDANSKTGALRQTLIYAFQGKVDEIAALNNTEVTPVDKQGRYAFELVATQPKHGVKSLTLEYDRKNGHLLLLTITENNGNYTTWSVE